MGSATLEAAGLSSQGNAPMSQWANAPMGQFANGGSDEPPRAASGGLIRRRSWAPALPGRPFQHASAPYTPGSSRKGLSDTSVGPTYV